MEMSNARQLAIIPSHGVEEAVACPRTQQQQDRKLKPHPEQALKCPRCASTNTKFCYYNNYSFFQPRYFCKGCRRYWTQGGTLRNVPVGGGCRKKRSSSSSSKKAQDQDLTNSNPLLPPLITAPPFPYDPSDFTLAFACHPKQHLTKQFGLDDTNHNLLLGNTNTDPLVPSAPAPANGFLDILSNGLVDITSPSAFDHNLYSGFGASGSLEMATGVSGEEGGLSFEAVLSDATASTTTSQGSCRAMDGGDNKELVMDLRLQDGNMDSKRDCWINGIGSSWQGLINSSLL